MRSRTAGARLGSGGSRRRLASLYPRSIRRRALHLTLIVAAAAALAWPGIASAKGRIVTWDDREVKQSRFVDPSEAPKGHYNEPPGVEERPNALRVNVYLPDSYSRRRDRRYPVLYLLHGQGDGYDTWAHPKRGDLRVTASGFPGFIVMPEADRGFYTNWWNDGQRGDPAWERYHLEELIPLAEERLPIRRDRRWHALAGLSMGGLGSVFYASQRPGYFGAAASFSGALSIQRETFQQGFQFTGQQAEPIWGDPEAQEFYWRGHNPEELVENLRHTRVYVAAGDGVPGPDPDEIDNTFGQVAEAELRQHAEEFTAAAQEAGVQVTYEPHQGIHDWPYWRRDLQAAIDWGLFEAPPEPDGSWTYETVAKVGEMWDLRFRFRRAPNEVITFTREGSTLSALGSGEVTICSRQGKFTAELPFERELPRGESGQRCRS